MRAYVAYGTGDTGLMPDVWKLPVCCSVLVKRVDYWWQGRSHASAGGKVKSVMSGLCRVVVVATAPDVEYSWDSRE